MTSEPLIASITFGTTMVMVSTRDHAIAVQDYFASADGSITEKPSVIRGIGQKRMQMTDYMAVGNHQETSAFAKSNAKLMALNGIDFTKAFMDTQIAFEQGRLKQHALPRVGYPISILQIDLLGGPAWVPGYQGACPAIQPIKLK